MIEDTYKGGQWLRRWSLLSGRPSCVMDALEVISLPSAAITAIQAENERVRLLVAQVEAYEDNLRRANPSEMPTDFLEVLDEEGWVQQVPNPAKVEMQQAQALVDATPLEIVSMAERRTADEPFPTKHVAVLNEDGLVVNVLMVDDDWQADEDHITYEMSPASLPAVGAKWDGTAFTPPSTVPVPQLITNAQGMATLRETFRPADNGKSLHMVISEFLHNGELATRSLPENDPQRMQIDVLRIAWDQTNEWQRNGTTVQALAAQLSLSPELVDQLFITAAQKAL